MSLHRREMVLDLLFLLHPWQARWASHWFPSARLSEQENTRGGLSERGGRGRVTHECCTYCTGPENNTCKWLRECCRQVEAEPREPRVFRSVKQQQEQTSPKQSICTANWENDIIAVNLQWKPKINVDDYLMKNLFLILFISIDGLTALYCTQI